MTQFGSSPNYRLGSLYSVATAFLLATQEPFSFLAAKRLNAMQFVCITQIALLLSIPLLLTRSVSRRDFFALLSNPTNLWRLAVIFAIGLTGLLLYNAGLSNAHPIIIAAILNLSPFWAALVARVDFEEAHSHLAVDLLWLSGRRLCGRDGDPPQSDGQRPYAVPCKLGGERPAWQLDSMRSLFPFARPSGER